MRLLQRCLRSARDSSGSILPLETTRMRGRFWLDDSGFAGFA